MDFSESGHLAAGASPRPTDKPIYIAKNPQAGVEFPKTGTLRRGQILRIQAPFCLLRKHFPFQGNNPRPTLQNTFCARSVKSYQIMRAIRESPVQPVGNDRRRVPPDAIKIYGRARNARPYAHIVFYA